MPDGLFIMSVGLTLHPWNKGALSSFLRWAGIQWLLITFTVVSMVQIGPQRRNISRLVLETPFLNVLGYVSYPMCKLKNATMVLRSSIPPDHNSFLFTVDLLQEVCFNFYAQVLDDDVRLGVFPMSSSRVIQINYGYHGASDHFFRGKTLISKVIAVITLLLAVCYPLQKYFQEDCVFRIQKSKDD